MKEQNINNFKLITQDSFALDPLQIANMTPHLSANPFGDWVGLACALKLMTEDLPKQNYKILEVGTAHGHFVRTMYNFLEVLKPGKTIAYGMDSKLHGYCPCQIQGDRMVFVDGKSTDMAVVNSLPKNFNFIFIDACHCWLHAYKDLCAFSPRLMKGGYLALHDTSPTFQYGSEQPRTPECAEDTHANVVKGINEFDMQKNGFELVLEEYSTDSTYWGGVRCYKKL